jgi:lipoprotein-anchoring transpeptidase ErfK/SrfK
MRDGIDEQSREAQYFDARFADLGAQLENGVAAQPPAWVRNRSRKIRQERRRRGAMVLVTAMAVAGVGVGSLALGSGDRRPGIVGPAATGTPGVSAPVPVPATPSAASASPSSEEAPAASGRTVVVDVERDVMTVSDAHGKVVRTVPITAGTSAHPTRAGVYTVNAKKPTMTIESKSVGVPDSSDTYVVTVDWVVVLDANGPMLYAAPWQPTAYGKRNTTHGDIGMSPADAEWLCGFLSVGDRVQVR